ADECLLARMSGRGATCFGLFDDAGGAARAAAIMSQNRPQWWVRAAPLLDDTRTLRT
ncbi:MAG: 4-(cytidine 5'-diphospho)-2-C-methyl-D-erythritol kinase, partial [Proteobacteria bacterium]|nr:4-(cytidine 5'-diphospho)-2-C-methyl-D-erythritol kinase [Pseudomonadota bacterium]